MENENQHISSPEGVRVLMQELWARHQSGVENSEGKVYYIDFPEPIAEEREQIRRNRAERPNPNIPIDEEELRKALEKFHGW